MKSPFLKYLFLFLLLPLVHFAQSTFFKRYTDLSTDLIGYSSLSTSDGGFLVGQGNNLEDLGSFQLIKTDSSGDSVWSVVFLDTAFISLLKAKETYDKNFIVSGAIWDVNQDTGYTILTKISATGTILWNKNFYNGSYFSNIAITSDSGYIIATSSSSSHQILIIKTDSGGNEQWEKAIPFSLYNSVTASGEIPYSIQKTMDGGYIIAGYGYYSPYSAYKIVKIDSYGGVQWTKLYSSDAWDDLLIGTLHVSENTYGNYYLFSTEGDFMSPLFMYCLKLNSNGDSIWAKSYIGNGESILGGGIVTSDDGTILSGITAADSIDDKGATIMYILKTDANGDIVWENKLDIQPVIGTDDRLYALEMDSIENKGFVISGWIYDINTYKTDACLMKTNQLGNILLNSNNVWPGDANSDLTANNLDLLNLGVAFGSNGTTRAGASNNWTEQTSTDWGTTFSNSIDYKNADCNGDGSINDDDTLAIYLNYGLTHNKTTLANYATATDPDLYLELVKDTANTSDTLHIAIKLGRSSIPASNVYGLAFSVNYNSLMIDSGSAKVNFNNSWLGNKTNSLSLVKDLYSNGKIDISFTRKDQQNQTGYGDIGELEVVLEDNISGKDTIYKLINFSISDVKVISNNESEIAVNLGNDSVVVGGLAGIWEEVIQDRVKLFPNPTNNFLSIELPSNEAYDITIFNSIGLLVYASKHTAQTTKLTMDLRQLPAGVYMLEVKKSNGAKAIEKVLKF